jgi:hypothetical protein
MHVEFHPHASERLGERGATQAEVIDTVLHGEHFPAKFNRMGFRKVFAYNAVWRGRIYLHKEVEAIAVDTPTGVLVLTVITRYFGNMR